MVFIMPVESEHDIKGKTRQLNYICTVKLYLLNFGYDGRKF